MLLVTASRSPGLAADPDGAVGPVGYRLGTIPALSQTRGNRVSANSGMHGTSVAGLGFLAAALSPPLSPPLSPRCEVLVKLL